MHIPMHVNEPLLLSATQQHGLKGNRAVSGSVWSVVTAATRAFPIQLSPSVDKAQTVADACTDADLVQTWVLQVSALAGTVAAVDLEFPASVSVPADMWFSVSAGAVRQSHRP
jgi:hypothetical protein